jgi:hypothetical protein
MGYWLRWEIWQNMQLRQNWNLSWDKVVSDYSNGPQKGEDFLLSFQHCSMPLGLFAYCIVTRPWLRQFLELLHWFILGFKGNKCNLSRLLCSRCEPLYSSNLVEAGSRNDSMLIIGTRFYLWSARDLGEIDEAEDQMPKIVTALTKSGVWASILIMNQQWLSRTRCLF